MRAERVAGCAADRLNPNRVMPAWEYTACGRTNAAGGFPRRRFLCVHGAMPYDTFS